MKSCPSNDHYKILEQEDITMKEVWLIDAVRTPFGLLGDKINDLSAP